MSEIFISYRADDDRFAAMLVEDRLRAVFGHDNVFADVCPTPRVRRSQTAESTIADQRLDGNLAAAGIAGARITAADGVYADSRRVAAADSPFVAADGGFADSRLVAAGGGFADLRRVVADGSFVDPLLAAAGIAGSRLAAGSGRAAESGLAAGSRLAAGCGEREAAIAGCAVVLPLIGKRWLSLRGTCGGRRIADPADFVAVGLATAIATGRRVLPVLLNGAPMPGAADLPAALRALADCRPVRLRSRTSNADLAYLAEQVSTSMRETEDRRLISPHC